MIYKVCTFYHSDIRNLHTRNIDCSGETGGIPVRSALRINHFKSMSNIQLTSFMYLGKINSKIPEL